MCSNIRSGKGAGAASRCAVCAGTPRWHSFRGSALRLCDQRRRPAPRPDREVILQPRLGLSLQELKQGSLRCTRVKGWLYYPQCFISWMGALFLFFFFSFSQWKVHGSHSFSKTESYETFKCPKFIAALCKTCPHSGRDWRELNCCYSPWSPAVVASMGQRSSLWANRSTIFG